MHNLPMLALSAPYTSCAVLFHCTWKLLSELALPYSPAHTNCWCNLDIWAHDCHAMHEDASQLCQSMQDVVAMINTNVTAVALLTRYFAPGMVDRNRGHIINVGSLLPCIGTAALMAVLICIKLQ